MACTALYTVSPTPDTSVPASTSPVPSGIVSGQTVSLDGGTTYSGTINIAGLSGVTIVQVGSGNAVIRPASGNNAINATGAMSCVIGNIASDGSNSIKIVNADRGIDLQGASGCSILRVDILNSSSQAIAISNGFSLNIQRCFIADCSATGIGSGKAYNTSITENTIRRCRNNGSFQGVGIYIEEGSSNTIASNLVTSCTYHGISYLKPVNGRINCNTVEYCPSGPDADSGGIYTQHITDTVFANAIISSNIVTNVTNGGKGIYLDDLATGVTVQRNTIRSCDEAILLHRARQCNIISNSCVAATIKFVNLAGGTGELFSNSITDNVFRGNLQIGEWIVAAETGNDFRDWVDFDRNYYFSNPSLFGRVWTSGPATDYTYTDWKALWGQDANSTYNTTIGSLSVVEDSGSSSATSTASTSTGPLNNRRLRKGQ